MNWKRMLLTAAGAGLLLFLPGPAQAHDRDDRCFERVRKEENKLERDIARHGFFSRQAAHRRERIGQLRSSCGFNARFHRDDREWRERRHREWREERRERRDRDRDRDWWRDRRRR